MEKRNTKVRLRDLARVVTVWTVTIIAVIAVSVFGLYHFYMRTSSAHPELSPAVISATIHMDNQPDLPVDIVADDNNEYIIRLHIAGHEAQKLKLYQVARKWNAIDDIGRDLNPDYPSGTWLNEKGEATHDPARSDWFTARELAALDLSPKEWEVYGEPREIVLVQATHDTVIYAATKGMDDSCRTTTDSNQAAHFTDEEWHSWLIWYGKESFRCTPVAK